MQSEEKTREILADLLAEHGLSTESLLYRSSLPEHLEAGEDGAWWISANATPSESVINIYDTGHLCQAEDMGPGLAFAQNENDEWSEPGRESVQLRLGDALDQGGLVYPVESVIVEPVWFFTLPKGGVGVRKLG